MTAPKTNRHKAGSVPQRMRAYFEANPNAEIQIGHLARELDTSKHTASQAVCRLRDAGILESLRVVRVKR